jgi:phthalate 4,5-dioxygenase
MYDIQDLTAVSPAYPMGRLLRRYWIPALMSDEISPGDQSLRLRLLGENLIAFRGNDGCVSIFDERCPHRGASLYYGRVEQGGIRCIYHGLKFDRLGTCIDAPALPSGATIPSDVRPKVYPTCEKGGLVWVYMGGDDEDIPELPAFPVLDLPIADIRVTCMQRECNFLQTIEGEMDGSHVVILHVGETERREDETKVQPPYYALQDTAIGVTAVIGSTVDEGQIFWRFSHFLLPLYTQPSPAPLGEETFFRAWVPMDDTHTMVFQVSSKTFCLSPDPKRRPLIFQAPGMSVDYEYLPNDTGWYGRWRVTANRANDHLMVRELDARIGFSGIEGLEIQDLAIQESMGPVVDRGREHLLPSDRVVVKIREQILKAVQECEAENVPPGIADPQLYRKWSGYLTASSEVEWASAYHSVIEAKL